MEEIIHTFIVALPTIVLFLIIAVMLYILSKGADILVEEAANLSLQLGISKMIIGATIVSIGTTLPEAAVSVLAAVNGNPDLALGNAIGSIIADTGLIIGIAALLGSLPVSNIVVKRQGKIQVWAGILLAVVSLPFISGSNIAQWVGWIFILLLIIYIYYSIKWSQESNSRGTVSSNIPEADLNSRETLFLRIIKLIAGLFLVIASSKILIPTVEVTAIRVGIPPSIIAATLVAFGTSLPELTTAITAVRKGHGELAVGNIVGADILNVLFVIGASASVTRGGLDVPVDFYKLQIPAMLIILITFRLFTKKEKDRITNKEGMFLFSLYIIYLILNFIIV